MAVELGALLEANNLVLFTALILVFVLSYKIMQTVVQATIISVLSAVFFYVLTYMGVGPDFTISNLLLFAVLGPALYIGYAVLFQVTDIALTVTGFVTRFVTGLWNLVRKLGGVFTGEGNSSSSTSSQNTGNSGGDESKEKEIILDELKE